MAFCIYEALWDFSDTCNFANVIQAYFDILTDNYLTMHSKIYICYKALLISNYLYLQSDTWVLDKALDNFML